MHSIVVTCKPGKRTCIKDCKSQKAKEEVSCFCETLHVFLVSSLSALAGELVKNLLCVLCQQEMSCPAIVSNYHIS